MPMAHGSRFAKNSRTLVRDSLRFTDLLIAPAYSKPYVKRGKNLTGTNRIPGRDIASQIASASTASSLLSNGPF
jgi:hypothetical protein